MRTSALGVAWFAVACSACSSQRAAPLVDLVDAGSVTSPATLAVARRLPLVASALAGAPVARLSPLPETADAPLRFTIAGGEVTVAPRLARPVAVQRLGAVGYYAGVADDVDVVHAPAAQAHEEAWILRSESAPHTLSWSLHAPSGVSLRLRERHVEAVDAAGVVRLSMVPPYVVDATGVERDVDLAYEASPGVEGAGSMTLHVDGHGLAYPLAVDPVWTTGASFVTLRMAGNDVVALGGGKAFIVGGKRKVDEVAISSAEVYDAATNKWSSVTSAPATVNGRALAVLTGGTKAGQVVVFQGSGTGTYLYDPAKNLWTTANPSSASVAEVTVFAAGARVLAPNIPAFFDSATNTWTATGVLPAAINGMCVNPTTLADGRVLCVDGMEPGGSPPGTALYRPGTNDWIAGPNALTTHNGGSTALLADGTVLVAGGTRGFGLSFAPSVAAELFNPATNTWATTANTLSQAGPIALVRHPNGYVFALSDILVDAYWPATKTFLESERAPSSLGAAALLTDGSILALGDTTSLSYRLVPKPLATACSASWECGSGFCVSGACCAAASCPAGFVCSSTVKPGVCTKVKGATCSLPSDCETGLCVDGRCCDRACGGNCEACDVLGSEGTCKTIVGAPHGLRAACAKDGTVCGQKTCNGVDPLACAFPGGSVPCGTPTCASGVESGLGVCKGNGSCATSSKSCGAYTCDASACKSKCTADTDCTTGFYCDKVVSACVPLTSLGKKCDAGSPCTAGLSCTDGVCCGKASCGAGSTCAWPGKEGSCTRQNGSACALDAECGGARCVDGVCCDAPCAGQCEACDVPGSLGACTPVTGKAHGARTACAAPADAPCAARLCDGTNRASCEAFVSSDVVCRAESCVDDAVTAKAVCDGKGACPADAKVSCDGFRCDPSGLACLGGCTREDQCVEGFKCAGGKCVKRAAVCSPDGTLVVDVDGKTTPCAPFACKAGSCASSCASTEDCRTGYLCDTASRTCVAPPAGDGGGGCATTSGRPGGGFVMFGILLAGLAARARRDGKKAVA